MACVKPLDKAGAGRDSKNASPDADIGLFFAIGVKNAFGHAVAFSDEVYCPPAFQAHSARFVSIPATLFFTGERWDVVVRPDSGTP
jgi:hypothetical protein